MMKVLIADDEMKVIQLIRYLVDWAAFDMEIVGTVNDGEKALGMISELQPDVVISDIRMPGLSGIELAARSQEMGVSPYFVIVSGYSEFEYAQKAIQLGVEDYLLKPLKKKDMEAVLTKIRDKFLARQMMAEKQTDLINRLEESKAKDKNNLLTDLLVKHNTRVLTLNDNDFLREYNCQLTGSLAECIVAHIYTCDIENHTAAADEYEFMISKFRDHMLERLRPICIEVLHIIWGEEIICLINHNEQDKAAVLEELQKLKINLLNYRNMFPSLRVAIAVSKPITSIHLIEESFQDARRTLSKRFCREDQLVFISDDYFPAAVQSDILTSKLRNELASRVELLDIEGYRSQLSEISISLESFIENPRFVEHNYEILVDTFLYGMKAHEQFYSREDFDKNFFLRGYNCLYSYRELRAWFSDTTCQLMQRCAEERRSQEEKPIRLAKKYIQEHYHESISLEEVSSHVGFHPAYLSTVFKKTTGENFTDYLKEVRIDRAKDLLLHTDLDVQSVASSVGYNDVKYFSRLFRKSTKLTPSEFRKMYG